MDYSDHIINIGSAEDAKQEGIVNLDIRPHPNVDIVSDAMKLPFEDESVGGIINRNIIEHFGRHEIKDLLKEWARVLKKDGFIRIETVDVGRTMTKWKEIPEENLLDAILGAQTYPENFHKMLFTEEILTRMIKEAGLEVLEVNQFEMREIPRIIVTAQKTL